MLVAGLPPTVCRCYPFIYLGGERQCGVKFFVPTPSPRVRLQIVSFFLSKRGFTLRQGKRMHNKDSQGTSEETARGFVMLLRYSEARSSDDYRKSTEDH